VDGCVIVCPFSWLVGGGGLAGTGPFGRTIVERDIAFVAFFNPVRRLDRFPNGI